MKKIVVISAGVLILMSTMVSCKHKGGCAAYQTTRLDKVASKTVKPV